MSAYTHDDTNDAHGHHDHKPAFFLRWLCSTNHKDIGTLYISFAVIGGVVGGILSEIMRAQLMFPGNHVVDSGQEWNTIVTFFRTRRISTSGRSVMSSCATITRPSSGRRNPIMCASVTDFPTPLRPMIATVSVFSGRAISWA